MFAAVKESGEMIGLAQTQWFPEERTLFLGYLAVQPSVQGQGFGSALFHEVARQYVAYQPEMILWDVESVEHQQTPAAEDQARRRIRFYERLGAQVIPGIHVCWGPVVQKMMLQRLAQLPDEEVIRRARRIFEGAYHGSFC
jgi:GNAT superfamily N-acetyltransferase